MNGERRQGRGTGHPVVLVDGRRPGAVTARGLAGNLATALADLLDPAPAVLPADRLLRGGDGAVPPGSAAVLVPCRRRPDPEGTAAVAAAARARGAARLVLVGSTEIYAPSHRSPGQIDEARLVPGALLHPVARRWWRTEEAARRGWGEGGPAPVVLRAAPAPFPGGDDWVSELLGGPWATSYPGFDPSLQLLAVPDLASAVVAALEAGAAAGTFNVVPAEVVPLGWALRLAGVRKIPLPQPAGDGGEDGEPPGAVRHGGRGAYLRHPWTASGARAAERLGFEARFGSAVAAAAMAAGEGWRPGAAWWSARRRVPLGFDDFGLAPRYVAGFDRTLFRFLHDAWWRVEHRGVEAVPRQGAAVLVGVHRGFMPWDGVMALHLVRREVGRTIRFLIHPSLVKFPFLANYMRRLGGVLACRENADHVLARGGVLGVFPEGIRGAFMPYRKVHRISRYFRRDYVRFAIAHGAPIVPFATVGSAEIYPILGRLDWDWWRRLSEWPYLPLTPTFPWLPVPLPSKWHTRFLEPVDVARLHPPEAADDPAVVAAVGEAVEARLQEALDDMVSRRRSWWRGRLWPAPR